MESANRKNTVFTLLFRKAGISNLSTKKTPVNTVLSVGAIGIFRPHGASLIQDFTNQELAPRRLIEVGSSSAARPLFER